MSIVAVHGPHTFGSKAIASNPTNTVTATVNPANGLIWTFTPRDQSQVAANYDWAYTPAGGSPASPLVDTKNPVFTFTAGTKTVTLTLNGVAQAPVTVTAVAGVAPLMAEGQSTEPEAAPEAAPELEAGPYDPGDHTVDEVKAYADEHPDEVEELLDAEELGKNRTTLVSYLEALADAE